MLTPESINTPVPPGTQVFRLARADTSTGQPSYTSFELSSEDRTQSPPKLSVWMVGLTQPWEARQLGTHPHLYPFALYLLTDTIRNLTQQIPDNLPTITPLDVVWDPLPTPASYIARPRWLDGHCGITGLERPPGMPRRVYKILRLLLFKEAQVVPISNGS